jgi:hypothetical protein
VKIENPAAFSFILQDEIYLLDQDKIKTDRSLPFTTVIETPANHFKYLGRYRKKLLIAAYYPDVEFIAANHLDALSKVLARLNFSMDDIAILNVANQPNAMFSDIMDFFKPQKLLLLGEKALPAGIESLTLNAPKQLNNCCTLLSFSFDEMMDNQEYKKAFWEEMKKL